MIYKCTCPINGLTLPAPLARRWYSLRWLPIILVLASSTVRAEQHEEVIATDTMSAPHQIQPEASATPSEPLGTSESGQTSPGNLGTDSPHSSLTDADLGPLVDTEQSIDAIPSIQPATLPHNLSPWGMFMAADWVVKTVMVALALASLLTWTVLVAKSIELRSEKRRLKQSLSHLTTAHTLASAANADTIFGVGRDFIAAAEAELHLSVDLSTQENGKAGIKERVASSLSRIEVSASRGLLVGTGLLATIGAIAPFVGLLGTVWGIMNSFIGISRANTTNLAVVAPGIAEALLATALGLVAAIPAVVIYNHFTRQIATTKVLITDSAAAVMRLVSRDLDRGGKLTSVQRMTGS